MRSFSISPTFFAATLFALVCFATPRASAQSFSAQSSSVSSSPAVAVLPSLSTGCPVKFSVQRKPAGAIVWTNGKHQQPLPGQGIQLNFSARDAARIVSATVIVHGTSGAVRAIPVAAAPNDSLTQTFDLDLHDGASLSPNRELWTKYMATISWIEITRIQFADGSAWHASKVEVCKAEPNGFLLVSAK